MALEPHLAFGLAGGEIVQDDMHFPIWMGGDDTVHEVGEFDAPASFVLAAEDFAGRHKPDCSLPPTSGEISCQRAQIC